MMDFSLGFINCNKVKEAMAFSCKCIRLPDDRTRLFECDLDAFIMRTFL